MKAVILAGGLGTRISEESYLRPKPMIEIGSLPIICHIMKYYSTFGIREFVICAGYKQNIIKEYFANYMLNNTDTHFDFKNKKIESLTDCVDDWQVDVIDTGINTMTGGRIKRVSKYLDDTFCLTYGDGLSDVDINQLIQFHKTKKQIATLTAVQPEGRFGVLDLKDDSVLTFREKKKSDTGWINGGYMVLEKEVMDYIDGDDTVFEQEPLMQLANDHQLNAYRHYGFWQCMDTLNDKNKLQKMWDTTCPPWKKW